MTPLSEKRRKAAALEYSGKGAPKVVAKAQDDYADVLSLIHISEPTRRS